MAAENLDKTTEPETSDSQNDSKGILDLLNSDDSTEETKEDAEDADSESTDESSTGEDESGDGDENTDEEETKEEEEIEEVKDDEEDNKELETATFRKLREKFPTIYKEFPGLRNQLGREKAFSEIFPTVEEAREANTKVQVFDYFNQELTQGDPVKLIEALPNMEQATRFAENILPALRQASPQLFSKAIDPVFRHALHKIAKDAENAGDKNLRASVSHVARYLFGKPELPELPQARNQQVDPEKELLKQQLTQTQIREYDRFQGSIDKAIINQATKEAKSYFDPQNTLTPKAQEVWIDRIIQEVDEELKNDPTHMARMKAFRDRALKSGLPDELRGRMLAAWLSTARPVLKTISQRIKREAFGKPGERTPEQKRSEKKVIPSSSGKTPGGKPNPNATILPKDVKQFKAKGGSMEDLLRA